MAVESAVVILDRGPEAQQHSVAAVFVADHGNRTVQVAESDPMIREVAFLPLETPKCKRNIEAAALVGDRDERALGGEHDLDRNHLGGIASVAVLVGVAENVPQR